MGYADSLLTDGEYIVYRTREHPLARLFASKWGIGLAGIGLALAILYVLGWGSGPIAPVLGPAILILLVVGLGLIGVTYVAWYNEDYLITNRRVIKLSGILSKRAADSSLEKINDAILEQSVLGRLFDWGNLQVLTASEQADLDYRMLHHAVEFKKVMLMTKHDLETGSDRGDIRRSAAAPMDLAGEPVAPAAPPAPVAAPVVAPPPPAPAAPTVEEKLRSLSKLRDDGIITPEDYEAKKAELLDAL